MPISDVDYQKIQLTRQLQQQLKHKLTHQSGWFEFKYLKIVHNQLKPLSRQQKPDYDALILAMQMQINTWLQQYQIAILPTNRPNSDRVFNELSNHLIRIYRQLLDEFILTAQKYRIKLKNQAYVESQLQLIVDWLDNKRQKVSIQPVNNLAVQFIDWLQHVDNACQNGQQNIFKTLQ